MMHPLDDMNTYDANPTQDGLKISDTGMPQKGGQNGGDLLKLLMQLIQGGDASSGQDGSVVNSQPGY